MVLLKMFYYYSYSVPMASKTQRYAAPTVKYEYLLMGIFLTFFRYLKNISYKIKYRQPE